MSSGFITEAEIEEKRRARQEEWDRVRKPDDPIEAPPEEPKDNRSLFDRLQEQKMKKQDEYDEAHKLKNLVKVLDDDEVTFLEFVDKSRMEEDRKKRLEEAKELSEFRSEVARLREQEIDNYIQQEIAAPKAVSRNPGADPTKKSQTQLLAGAVVRRNSRNASSMSSTDTKKQKLDNAVEAPVKDPIEGTSTTSTSSVVQTPQLETNTASRTSNNVTVLKNCVPYKGNLICIGHLPGLAAYSDDSDSDSDDNFDSSDSDSDDPSRDSIPRDLCGRPLIDETKVVAAAAAQMAAANANSKQK